MKTQISFAEKAASARFFGTRFRALALRDEIEALLALNHEVTLDFAGVDVTQSFIDELLGVLVLQHGKQVLDRLIFKSCSENVKAIVNFVLSDRLHQIEARQLAVTH